MHTHTHTHTHTHMHTHTHTQPPQPTVCEHSHCETTRCAVWLVVAFGYSAVAVLFAERLLRLAAQPADVAAASAAYARVQLPGVPLYWAANALQTVCDGLQDTRESK